MMLGQREKLAPVETAVKATVRQEPNARRIQVRAGTGAQKPESVSSVFRKARHGVRTIIRVLGAGVSETQCSRMDDSVRSEIANCLELLAAEPLWNAGLWQRCYDLVTANS